MRITLYIPTLNPAPFVESLIESIKKQSLPPDSVLIVDSSSDDGTLCCFECLGATIHTIQRDEFDHGGTRNLAFSLCEADIYLFLTQDALPADEFAFEKLLDGFKNSKVGAVYGRQLPASDATPVAAHARLYNYSEKYRVVSRNDIGALGIKAAFCSNSFAAYRKEALEDVGFFPPKLIFGEDTYAAAKMLEKGWSIAYAAEAAVIHSHNYTLRQEFSRYFDVGVFHSVETWYRELLGKAEGEGMRFVKSEFQYLKDYNVPFAFPRVIVRNGIRWLGYRLGIMHAYLPLSLKQALSMNKGYWLSGDK